MLQITLNLSCKWHQTPTVRDFSTSDNRSALSWRNLGKYAWYFIHNSSFTIPLDRYSHIQNKSTVVTLSSSMPSVLCGFLTLPAQSISTSIGSRWCHFDSDWSTLHCATKHLSNKPRRGEDRHVVLNVFNNSQVPEVITISITLVICDRADQSDLASNVSFSWK